MSARRVSVGQVMIVVAVVAVNLAVARAVPWEIVVYPSIWVLLGSMDFLIVWKAILRRSLRAFQYTALIVFVVAFVIAANLVATERFHPLGLLVRGYQQLAGEEASLLSVGYLEIGEIWGACFLSLVLACAVGWGASWLERRCGWDIAAFCRGALLGLGVAYLFSVAVHAAWSAAEPPSLLRLERIVLGTCLIVGGLLGLSRLKSAGPRAHDPAAVPPDGAATG